MAKQIVAILRPIPEPARSILTKKYTLRENKTDTILSKEKLKTLVTGVHAILSILTDRIDEEIMVAAGPQLKIIANFAVGFDNIDLEAAKRRQIAVTNTPGILTEAVAEHAFGLILACARRIVESDRFLREGKYTGWEPLGFLGPQLWGKTLAVIGLGRIGSWVAQIAHAGFGMNIVYYDLMRNHEFEMRLNARFHELSTALRLGDVISIHVPLLPSTHHLIGRPEFSLMKETAILVNTSRGPVIDEAALVLALKQKKIAAAGLDVYEHEPRLTRGLTDLPNVVLTPHTASATLEARQAMSKIAADNIVAVLSGRKAINSV